MIPARLLIFRPDGAPEHKELAETAGLPVLLVLADL
jgi:hypothetical protein